MFESFGEMVVVLVLLGVTVLAFAYLGFRGGQGRRTNNQPPGDSMGNSRHGSTGSA